MDNIFTIFSMVGGLALFLYGMNLLSSNLEKISGRKLEAFLEKATNNIFKGLLIGLLITVALQSSSATTVIVVGLVNAGVLKLKKSIPIIMGANIGTTITAQILSLNELKSTVSIIQFLKPENFAPIICLIGIILFMVSKKKSKKYIGEMLLGFGILFFGMLTMVDATSSFSNSPIFTNLFSTLTNPILGILAGAGVTAVIQSSSASIGILQALATTGSITCAAAFPIILGQNIGTCVTSIISSIGATKNAKRAAAIHLIFNLIGTVIFIIGLYAIQFIIGLPFWNDAITMNGIANFHTIFNIGSTLLLLPFISLIEKLALIIVKDKKDENELDKDVLNELNLLDSRLLATPSIALSKCKDVLLKMSEYSKSNFSDSLELLYQFDTQRFENILTREKIINTMEDNLNNYLLEISSSELTNKENKRLTYFLKLVTEFERIGDYSIDIAKAAQSLYQDNMEFSKYAISETKILGKAVEEIITKTFEAFKKSDKSATISIEALEETIDQLHEELKRRHVERFKTGTCNTDTAFIYIETLNYLEKISDHCSNIGVYILGYKHNGEFLSKHEYIRKIYNSETSEHQEFLAFFSNYKEKYILNN